MVQNPVTLTERVAEQANIILIRIISRLVIIKNHLRFRPPLTHTELKIFLYESIKAAGDTLMMCILVLVLAACKMFISKVNRSRQSDICCFMMRRAR